MSADPPRIASVDALRGLTVAAMLFVNNPGDWQHVLPPFRHAEWHGFTLTDVIFPVFLFIMGVSIALGIGARLQAGAAARELGRPVLWRALRLFALGVFLNLIAFVAFDLDAPRVMGVLQRIAICYAVVALLAMYLAPRAQWLVLLALLPGYWGLLVWGGPLTPEGNLASRVDTAVLGPFLFEFNTASGRGHDPEGLLTTLPAIANTLLGLQAGQWLRRGDLRRLLLAGAVSLLLGYLWSAVLPLNKHLWTSSFVLWTCGWSFLALALAHVLIERWGWPAIGRSFGVNAIAMFAGSMILMYALIGLGLLKPFYEDGIASWLTPLAGPFASSHALAALFVAFWWLLARRLDARGIHFRI